MALFNKADGVSWALVAAVFILDCTSPANIVTPALYVLVPLTQKHDSSRIWLLTVSCLGLTFLAPVIGAPPTQAHHPTVWLINRSLAAICILIVAFTTNLRNIADAQRERADSELREAVKAREIFIAMLAHELRNPLAALSNGTAIFRKSQSNVDQRILAMMERQVRQLIRLIDDLLDIARIRGAKIHLQRELIDLRDVVQSACEACEAEIQKADQSLTIRIADDTPRIYADAARISQALVNLIDNACKFSPPGGAIEIAIQRQESEVVIAVRDNGCGIAPETLPKIFTLFECGAETSPIRGLGIGLAFAREVIELHGGSVEAHSDGPDKGSEFILRLPILPTSSDSETNALTTIVGNEPVATRSLACSVRHEAAQTLSVFWGEKEPA